MKTTAFLGVLLLVWTSGSIAQTSTDNGNFSGLVFSDYFWIANNHDSSIEGKNGFWLRRVYFTYDRQISSNISARFRLEGSTPGDFISSAKIRPEVKDLYLRWEKGLHQVEVGISSTPTFALVEDVWGYRSVEKSPLDLLDFASSRDFGISVAGSFDPDERLNYHLMLGNGSGNGAEINKGKKIMLSLGYELTDNFLVEAYGDYESQNNNQDWYTLQGFAGYRSEDVNFGVLYAHQVRKNVLGTSDLNLDILSLFTNFTISDSDGISGYLRLDRTFEPIPGVHENAYFPISNQAASSIIIGGLDFDLSHNIHLMPNIETAFYEENNQGSGAPDSDLIPRLTLFYIF